MTRDHEPVRVPPLALLAMAAGAQRALSRRDRRPAAWRTLAAGAVGLASGGLLAGSVGAFRLRGTTVNPVDPGRVSALVTSGPNAVSRNPMYVGMAGVLAAHALWRGSWPALLPAAAFGVAVDRLQIRAEERALLARFGAEYETYRDRVPRWLGPVRARA